MEKRRSLKEILVSDYSFNKASFKWIPKGGDILESIGQEVVYIEYTRENEEAQWEIKVKRAYIQSIHDFEPMTGTYEIIFTVIGDETEENLLKKERIIPEGFSYNNPDIHNWMHRFVPYSLHFKLGEVEAHYARLKMLFETRQGMTMADIKKIQTEDPEKKLGFFNNVQAIINTDIEGGLGIGIIAFRVHEISEPKLLSKTWRYGLRDADGNYFSIRIDKNDENTDVIKAWTVGEEVIGDLKIMDIADQTKADPYEAAVENVEEKTED